MIKKNQPEDSDCQLEYVSWSHKLMCARMMPNDPKLSHGANNRKRGFAAKRKMKEQPPLAPARC
jgi:hypothetical protein